MSYQPSFINVSFSSFTPSLASTNVSPTCAVCHQRPSVPTMLAEDKSKGFGKQKPSNSQTPSETSKRRDAASSRYDEMAAAGMPEYSVWFRLKKGGVEDEEEEMPWLPVGAISVPRSSQVGDALFEPKTQEDLMKGAIRLYPNLQKEEKENIEFGYQLKDFDDEPIRIAVPSPKSGWQATLTKVFRRLQNPLTQ